ncbi:4-hydroxythreonine-4-phosphate dehydrogenase PdxA [Bdellovibrionota bacterium FG-2]
MSKPLTLVITPGDPSGIGPELVACIFENRRRLPRGVRLFCVGAIEPFLKLGAKIFPISSAADLNSPLFLGQRSASVIPIIPTPLPARGLHAEGFQAGWSIERATRLVLDGSADALVTGPIHKARFQAGGFAFPGHTEFLESLCHARGVTMMLANDQLRVSLVTTHLALNQVSRTLTKKLIQDTILRTANFLSRELRILKPKIAVAALNPHAGEGGVFGDEEQRLIIPALSGLKGRTPASLTGPLPADTLFALNAASKNRFDAVICMYHDQGLIPVKLLDFKNTVNITLGLPIIRTSVDHGVGFDIVGRGSADPSSLLAAIKLAVALAVARGKKRN